MTPAVTKHEKNAQHYFKSFKFLIYNLKLKEMGICLSCDDDNNYNRRVVYVPTNPPYQCPYNIPNGPYPPKNAYEYGYAYPPPVYDYNQRSLGNSYGQTQTFVGGMLGGMLLGDALDMDIF